MRKLLGILITGMVMIALGMALVIISYFVLGFDVKSLNTQNFETRDYEITEEFQDINVHVNTAEIVMVPSKDGSCKVTCHVKENITCNVVVKDGMLNVTTEDEKSFSAIELNWDFPKITIELPDQTYGTISVVTNTGDVSLSEVLSSNDLTLKTNTGDVTLKECDAKTLYLKTNTGDVKATLLSDKVFKVKTTIGDVDVPENGDGGTCEIITNSGDVKVEIK